MAAKRKRKGPADRICDCGQQDAAGIMMLRSPDDVGKFVLVTWCGSCGGLCRMFETIRCGKKDVPLEKFRRGWGSFGYVPAGDTG